MSIWNWGEWIDGITPDAQLTLGEGNTPVIRSRRIGPACGLNYLYFKLETTNPSGSFKDRFGAAAVSHMRAAGQTQCIATSSGNTGAALAAYCAAAGLRCRIALVEPAPVGKMTQMLAYGAEIFRVRGFGLDAGVTVETFETLKRIGSRPDSALQVSSYIYSVPGMTGVESISFEIADQFPETVDHVFCPAGGGGLCVAVARGFARLVESGEIPQSPKVECAQPEGNNTIAAPLRDGLPRAQEVESTTKISGLQVPNINDGHLVIEECRPTGGTGHIVTDDEVWAMQKRLAQEEGVFSEPAGAVSVAAAVQAAKEGRIDSDAVVVSLVTGIGFKDTASVDRMVAGTDCPLISLADLKSELPAGTE